MAESNDSYKETDEVNQGDIPGSYLAGDPQERLPRKITGNLIITMDDYFDWTHYEYEEIE